MSHPEHVTHVTAAQTHIVRNASSYKFTHEKGDVMCCVCKIRQVNYKFYS